MGGNAVDAACAAAWALGVCEPGESGLGGQTTMLIHLAGGKNGPRRLVLDGHSHAPASLTRKLVGPRAQQRGIRSTTVPSTPATLDEALRRFGTLSLATVLGPAMRLAFEGYAITRLQRRLLKWTAPFFAPDSQESRLFFGEDGAPHRVGFCFRQPVLGRTLERLALHGVRDFYEGEIARAITRDMELRGGLIDAADLKDLSLPVEREPMEIEYRGRRVVSIPPPGGGAQVLLALRILEGLLRPKDDLASWHVYVAQSTRAAFRERERWPDHPLDMSPSIARWMVSAQRSQRLVEDIREHREPERVRDTMGEDGNTTHLCAADPQGNVVSLTQSIQSVFGAKVANPELGFVYNNYLSTCPRSPHPYRLGPGSLPQSNAAPTLVLDQEGRPLLALGSAGSRRITSSVVQVISGVLDRGLLVAEAVVAPRAHALISGPVWLERSAPIEVGAALAREVGPVKSLPHLNYKLGAVQALQWDESGQLSAAADPRRDGGVAGLEAVGVESP